MGNVVDESAPSQSDDQKRIVFRFSHATAETHSIPASLLIQTLEGAQRVIWLLALAEENRDIKLRARIPAEIEQRYQLRCDLAEPGSYSMPAAVVSDGQFPGGIDLSSKIMDRFEEVASAVVQGEREALPTDAGQRDSSARAGELALARSLRARNSDG